MVFFFKQKTAYEMRISDWSSDVCSSDLDGLSPQQFGQLTCLQTIYPPRIAGLMDIAAPPLVPVGVKTVPITPLKKAYPDDWQQAGYQAQFSPDKTLMALGVEDGAGYVKQVWLDRTSGVEGKSVSVRVER